jgi:hypothetical protein
MVTGQVLSITFNSRILVVAGNGTKVVQAPHWTPQLAPRLTDGDGSFKPAIFQSGLTSTAEVIVQINATDGATGQGILQGSLGGIQLSGTVPILVGQHNVVVTLQGPHNEIARHAGDVEWTVTDQFFASSILAGRTRLEIFFVLASPMPFFSGGVWVEALRFLVKKVGLSGVSDPKVAVADIVQFCHSSHNLIYNSGGGSTFYSVDFTGGTFILSVFVTPAAEPRVTCYDLTAAIKVLSGALGISVTWSNIEPFGFLKLNKLIGVGDCNNPFFMSSGTTPVIEPHDSKREPFLNHSFCQVSDLVFDACIGPQRGNEKAAPYLINAVDTEVPVVFGMANPSDIKTLPDPIFGLR